MNTTEEQEIEILSLFLTNGDNKKIQPNYLDNPFMSWDILMEVINKLTTLNEFQDYEFKSLFWDTFCQLDIEEVYTQVVLFIQWYNENK